MVRLMSTRTRTKIRILLKEAVMMLPEMMLRVHVADYHEWEKCNSNAAHDHDRDCCEEV